MNVELKMDINDNLELCVLIVQESNDSIGFTTIKRTNTSSEVSKLLTVKTEDIIKVCKSDFPCYCTAKDSPKTAKGFPYKLHIFVEEGDDSILIGKDLICTYNKNTLELTGLSMTSFLILAIEHNSGDLLNDVLAKMKTKGEA